MQQKWIQQDIQVVVTRDHTHRILSDFRSRSPLFPFLPNSARWERPSCFSRELKIKCVDSHKDCRVGTSYSWNRVAICEKALSKGSESYYTSIWGIDNKPNTQASIESVVVFTVKVENGYRLGLTTCRKKRSTLDSVTQFQLNLSAEQEETWVGYRFRRSLYPGTR